MKIPELVRRGVERALGSERLTFSLFTAGFSERTYMVEDGRRRWVARMQAAPAEELRRAYAAQQLGRAAGVRVPVIVSHNLELVHEEYGWVVEEYMRGAGFDHQGFDRAETKQAAVDLGRQLRLLHGVELDAFGLVPPRPYEVYATFQQWVANQERRIEGALRICGEPLVYLPTIQDAYRMLSETYSGGPRLIKSDCVGDNLLVDAGRVVALIDWEWSQGADPAFEVSYWFFRSQTPQALDAIMAGYGPDDPALFRRRVLAYQVLHALDQVHIFDEYRTSMTSADFRQALAFCSQTLEAYMRTRPWER